MNHETILKYSKVDNKESYCSINDAQSPRSSSKRNR